MLDEVRNKLASMFAPSVRKHVTGEMMTKQESENFRKNATGIFGGAFIYHDYFLLQLTFW